MRYLDDLKNASPENREKAAVKLGELGEKASSALPELLRVLEVKDENLGMKIAVLKAIRSIDRKLFGGIADWRSFQQSAGTELDTLLWILRMFFCLNHRNLFEESGSATLTNRI